MPPLWAIEFQALKDVIGSSLGDKFPIEHVGNTSVAGLPVKPIIESKDQLPRVIKSLIKLGYQHEGNLGVQGGEAFRYADILITNDFSVTLKIFCKGNPQISELTQTTKHRSALVALLRDGTSCLTCHPERSRGISKTENSSV